MKLLVCGGRDYQDAAAVDVVLSAVHAQSPLSSLIQGGANGADRLAAEWAWDRKVPVGTFNADWDTHGRAAGSIRNQRMLDEGKPDAVVAFPGGRGTADMVRRAHAAGLPVWEPYRPQPTVEHRTAVWSFDAESQASKSQADLRKFGSRYYLSHPTCKCVLFAYHPIGAPELPKVWFHGQPPPADLLAHVAAGGKLSGWNVSQFDRLLWDWRLVQDHGFPPIPPEAWLDSMHTAAAANLPRGLAGACKSVGVPFVEDLKDQNRLLRITDTDRTPVIGQDDLEWLTNRCVQDVLMEERALMAMPPWPIVSPWVRMPAVDQRINDRGVLMDVPLVQGLARAATLETKRLDAEMDKLTNGSVGATTQIERLKNWLVLNGVELPRIKEKPKPKSDDPQEMLDELQDADMSGDTEDEFNADDKLAFRLRKSDIADLLARTDVPEHCRQALRMRAEAAKASAKKLTAMLKSAGPDGRLRGALVLGGAQQTLRWSGAVWQPHNFVRDVIANPDEVAETNGWNIKTDKARVYRAAAQSLTVAVEAGRTGDPRLIETLFGMWRKDLQGRPYYDGTLPFISRMLRRTLAARIRKLFLNGDFANIEARIPVWLAQQVNVLEAFRRGEDVYRLQAAPIYGLRPEDLTKEQRQIGKVCIAEGSLVLTDQGEVPVQKVTRDMRLWDGVEWVSHDGPVYNGIQNVIEYDGLCATSDHLVWTEGQQAPMEFGHAAARQKHLVRSGDHGTAIRVGSNHLSRETQDHGRPHVRSYRVYRLSKRAVVLLSKPHTRSISRLSAVLAASATSNMHASCIERRQNAMHKPERSSVQELRCPRYSVSVRFSDGGGAVDPGQHRTTKRRGRVGSRGQQRALRAGQPALGGSLHECDEPTEHSIYRVQRETDNHRARFARRAVSPTGCAVRRSDDTPFPRGHRKYRVCIEQDRQPATDRKTARPVWDILNAGPRHRFTVSGRLVANCTLFLGFAGGVNAFIPAAMNYGLSIDRETGAGIVRTFRQTNPELTAFWDAALLAAIYAVSNPGYRYDVPPLNLVSWFMQGGALCCQLPSGRLLRYWSPRLQAGKWPDGRPKALPDLTALSVKGRAVFRRTLWRGLICENITQAIAADLLGTALDNMDRYTDDAGLSQLPVCLHVHDNALAEVDEDKAEPLLPIFKAAMLDAPAWTKGLPLDAAVGIEARFS